MLTRLRTAIVRAHRQQEGVTLVELLMVLLIGGAIGSIILQATVQSLRTTSRTNDRTEALANLERGLERISRELRGADPLQIDSSGDYFNSVTAVVTRGGQRVAYRYYIKPSAPDELWETVTVYNTDGTVASTTPTEFIVEIANDALGLDLFTYLDSQGNELTCTAAEISSGACLNTVVTAEQIRLTISRQIDSGEPLVMQTTVGIRSTRYSNDPTDLGVVVL